MAGLHFVWSSGMANYVRADKFLAGRDEQLRDGWLLVVPDPYNYSGCGLGSDLAKKLSILPDPDTYH
jgi:hypothetical protein